MNIQLLNEAIDFYNAGNSMALTARTFRSTPGTLKKLFNAKGIHIRNQGEQCILENKKRAKKVNHQYFEILNYKNSYYLGFIAADGTIRKDRNEIKIALSSVDKDFLTQMKQDMDIETELHNYNTNNGFSCTELRFSSAQIKQDLAKYGVIPNKTIHGLNLNLIPNEFKIAFIKGFFDGDGSFSYNKNTKQAKISFTSHTSSILKQINNYFNSQGYIYQDKRTQVYNLEFSTLPSLKIMEQFYMIDSPCLQRKFKKYQECLKLREQNPRDRDSLDKE